MSAEQVKENLEILPEHIRKKEEQILARTFELTELNLMTKSTEIAEEYKVETELTTDGKKKFSNATQRKVELDKRLEGHNSYQEQKKKTEELIKQIKQLEIDLGFLKRTFRSAEAFSRLGVD